MFMRLIAACLLLVSAPSFAQVRPSPTATPAPTATPVASVQPTISLKFAVEEALKNNPVIRGSAEAVNQSHYDKFALRSALLPSLDLTGKAAKRKDSVADRPVGAVNFGGSSYNQYNLDLHAEQPIFAYGLFAASKQASLQEDVSRKNLEIAKRDLSRDVVSVYYSTVYYENLVRILQEQERSLREIVGISRRRVSLGGKRVDYLQSQTQLALLLPKITKAQNSLMTSTANLAQLMGLENTSTLTIGTLIPELALKNVAPRVDLKQSTIPELERIRLEREKIGQERAIVMGGHLPQLSLQGDYGFSNFSKSELFDEPSRAWQAALVLKVPLFSGFSSVSQRRALVSRDIQLESQERNIRNNLSVSQIQSRKELESAESLLTAAQEGAKLARETLAEARRDYSVGLIDFVNYNTVQNANFDAATALLQNRLDAIKAYATYFTTTGQPISLLVDLLNQQPEKNQ